jgi:DNA-directed RNA polymerase specialized sigma24 family protein
VNTLCSLLEDHIANPRHRAPLASVDGTAQLESDDCRIRIELRIVDDTIVDVAFDAAGDPIAAGCASFVVSSIRGEAVGFAAHVRTYALAFTFDLPEDDPRAELVVRTLQAALRDYRGRQRRRSKPKLHAGRGGAPRGHRKLTALSAPPTREDQAMLLPGETHEMLMQERYEILGVIENLGECLALQMDSSRRARNRQWEDLMHLALDIDDARGLLSSRDQKLVQLMGFAGLNEAEAAEALGVTQPAVHKRVRVVAAQIQKIFRRRLFYPTPKRSSK